jgi:hypothetical protein
MKTLYQLRQERNSLINWIADSQFSHALTFNTERELSTSRLNAIFGRFCHEFDRAIHGRNLKRVPSAARLHAIAFPENLSTNAHLHAFVDLRPAIDAFGNEALALTRARTCWLRATKGPGSIHAEAAPDRGWGKYCTKRFNGNYFLSADYWPR